MYQTSESILTILVRDLKKVITELNAFEDEQNIWVLHGTINNTAGNLALHISGAVSHFIGAVLGKNGYVRVRQQEFALKDISRDEIISRVQEAARTVTIVLPSIKEDQLQEPFPEEIGNQTLSIGFFLTHLVGHVNYHLGQINYHRRLLDKHHAK
ncbi:MAG: DinB family protein [Chryseolinea sp.]